MRKLISRFIVIAFGIELMYLALANILLNTPIGASIINRQPEKFQLFWNKGWSIIPGHFSFKDIRIRGQTPRLQWYVEVGEGEIWIRWWKLPIKYFEASSVAARGLSLFMRQTPPDDNDISQSATPPIPGLDSPPQFLPEALYPSSGKPWQITLENFSFEDLHEIWIQQLRMTGKGNGSIGRYSTSSRGESASLENTVLEISNATVQFGGQTIAHNIQVEMEPTLAPVTVRGASLEHIAEHISGTISIAGKVNGLGLLNKLYQGMPLQVESEGEISLTTSLELQSGRLKPGSELRATTDELTAKYLHYTVEGKGIFSGKVSEHSGIPLTTLTLVFDDFALSDDTGDPYLRDRGFELVTSAHDVGLADSGQDLTVVATLPESFIPDITHYNDYIPSDLGVELEQGSGRLLSQFEFAKDDDTISGEIKLDLTDVVARYDAVTVTGHVDIHTVVKSGDLRTNHYDAAGTRIELNDITVSKNGEEITTDWWSKITLGKTKLDFKPAPALSGGIAIRMSDSVPILAIFEEQEDLPSWIKDDLNLENLEAEADLLLSDQVLNVSNFELNSGKWSLLGDLVLKPSGREGILYIEHGKLGLAIVRKGEQKKVKLLYGQDWFDAKRREFRSSQGQE